MKELISAILIFATALGGGAALKSFHDTVRVAAIKKAHQGLPSLSAMARNRQGDQTKNKDKK